MLPCWCLQNLIMDMTGAPDDMAAYANMEAACLLGSELAGLTLGPEARKPPLPPPLLQPPPTPPLHGSDSGGLQALQGTPHGLLGRSLPMQNMAGSPDGQMYTAARMLAAEQPATFPGTLRSLGWQGSQQQPPPPPPPPPPQRLQQRQQQQQTQAQAAAVATAAAAQCAEENTARNRRFSFRETIRLFSSWLPGSNALQLRQQQQQQQQEEQQQQQAAQELVQELARTVSMEGPQGSMLLPRMDLDLELPGYTHVSAEGFAGAAGPLCTSSAGGGSLQAALLREQSCSAPSNVVVSSQLSPGQADGARYGVQLPQLSRGPVSTKGCTMTLGISPLEAASIMQHIQPLMDATGSFVSVSFSNGAPVLTLDGEPGAVVNAVQYIQALQKQCRE